MKKKNIRMIAFFFFLISCSGKAVPTQSDFPLDTINSTVTESQTPTDEFTQPANTSVTPFPINSLATETPTTEEKSGVSRNCLDILPNLPQKHTYQGLIALKKVSGHSYQLYDIETGEIMDISGEKILGLSVSPNRMLYAYRDEQDGKLMVFSSDFHLQNSINWEKNWGNLVQWQDDQWILIEISNQVGQDIEEYPRTLMVIDSVTGERKILQPDYPNIDRSSTRLDWWGLGTTAYDPRLTEVVYPGTIDGQGMGYILFDILSEKKLVELPSPNFGNTPRWFFDGTRFAVKGIGGELFVVSRDGKVSQITHMNSDNNLDKNGYNYEGDNYSWSPTGEQIAMWLNSLETGVTSLSVVDTKSGKVTDLCVLAGYNPMFLPYPPLPVWSPDGKALIVEANFHPEDSSRDIVMVDFKDLTAYKILENYIPVGWLASR